MTAWAALLYEDDIARRHRRQSVDIPIFWKDGYCIKDEIFSPSPRIGEGRLFGAQLRATWDQAGCEDGDSFVSPALLKRFLGRFVPRFKRLAGNSDLERDGLRGQLFGLRQARR